MDEMVDNRLIECGECVDKYCTVKYCYGLLCVIVVYRRRVVHLSKRKMTLVKGKERLN